MGKQACVKNFHYALSDAFKKKKALVIQMFKNTK